MIMGVCSRGFKPWASFNGKPVTNYITTTIFLFTIVVVGINRFVIDVRNVINVIGLLLAMSIASTCLWLIFDSWDKSIVHTT